MTGGDIVGGKSEAGARLSNIFITDLKILVINNHSEARTELFRDSH